MTDRKSVEATVQGTDSGSFDILASTRTKDRDGDVLAQDGWKQPLPAKVPISADHDMSSAGVIGSGTPYFDPDGNLRIRGTFAGTGKAQEIRQLVTEGHLSGASVEFLHDRDTGKRELLGCAICYTPSNPDAKVLSAKGADSRLSRAFGQMQAVVKAGARNSSDDLAMIQAIHDASHILGAQCIAPTGDDAAEASPDDGDGSADGANKSMTMAEFEQILEQITKSPAGAVGRDGVRQSNTVSESEAELRIKALVEEITPPAQPATKSKPALFSDRWSGF